MLRVEPRIGRFFDRKRRLTSWRSSLCRIKRRLLGAALRTRSSAIGKRMVVQNTVLTIIGVAPAGFFGESVGQRPDVWAPLSMQPQLKPGRDWLRPPADPTEKVMWLHAFGRLKPGVTLNQAAARANVTFKQFPRRKTTRRCQKQAGASFWIENRR